MEGSETEEIQMPQIVKGGKNVFGWSHISETGQIMIPPDAFKEYGFTDGGKAFLMSGSKKSGGFGLTTQEKLENSPLSGIILAHPDLASYEIPEGQPIRYNSKVFCWVAITNQHFLVPWETLTLYGIQKGDRLLTVRGSSLALGFIVRGPIIEEATFHPELKTF